MSIDGIRLLLDQTVRKMVSLHDKKILVLEKSPMLRSFLETKLDTKIDADAELLDCPGPESYWVD